MPKIENIQFFCIVLSDHECASERWFYTTDLSITPEIFDAWCKEHMDEACRPVYKDKKNDKYAYIGWEDVLSSLANILTEKYDLHRVEAIHYTQYVGTSIIDDEWVSEQEKELLGEWLEKFSAHNKRILNDLYENIDLPLDEEEKK